MRIFFSIVLAERYKVKDTTPQKQTDKVAYTDKMGNLNLSLTWENNLYG